MCLTNLGIYKYELLDYTVNGRTKYEYINNIIFIQFFNIDFNDIKVITHPNWVKELMSKTSVIIEDIVATCSLVDDLGYTLEAFIHLDKVTFYGKSRGASGNIAVPIKNN